MYIEYITYLTMKYKFSLILTASSNDSGLQDTLNSVVHLVDHYVLYDTSTDSSCTATVQQWALENNKPGQVICPISDPSKHLKDNLNYLWTYVWLNLADDVEFLVYLKPGETFTLKSSKPPTYLSILDCLRLYLECKAASESLFSFVSVSDYSHFTRWNIARNHQQYSWQGTNIDTYLTAEHSCSTYHINWIVVTFSGIDEANETSLDSEDSDDPRSLFFLAQFYETRKDVLKAIELYRKRTRLLGDVQERYVTFLRLGRLLENYDEKIQVFMEGFKLLPNRLECLYEWMMTELRNKNNKDNHVRTVRVGKMASCTKDQTRYYNEQDFMVEPAIYEWRFDFDLAISCYYAQEFELGVEANQRALLKAPQHICNQIENNLAFFPKPDPVADQINALMLDDETFEAVTEPTINSVDCFGTVGKPQNRSNLLFVGDNFNVDFQAVRDLVTTSKYVNYGCGAFGVDDRINLLGYIATNVVEPDYATKVTEITQKILGRPIALKDLWLNGRYQYGTQESHDYVHRDQADWVVMIVLCPETAKSFPQLRFMAHRNLQTDVSVDGLSEAVMDKDSVLISAWDCVDLLTLYSNRCVIYNGRRSHIVTSLFGTCKENSFAFQKFYFDECK